VLGMDNRAIVEADWQYVLNMMPSDLEQMAVANSALRRRREIRSAGDLLRLALAYALCDFSLRQTAAWAELVGLGSLSDVAVLRRLEGADAWLGQLIVRWLQDRGLTTQVPSLWVRIVDATGVSEPGSHGTNWRIHLGLDLAQQRVATVEVTGPEAGETLRRHDFSPGETVLADRGYSQRAGVAGVLDQSGHVVVRLNWQNFPLETRRGKPLDVITCLETLAPDEIGDWAVQFRVEERVYPVRLIAVRKTEAAAAAEQKRLRQTKTAKGRLPDPRALRAAHFVYVITDWEASALPAVQILELYRLRWQIEMAFKRLKGILHLDHLRAKKPELARTYLYAKLLGALIVEELCGEALAFFPWGFPFLPQARQPLAGVPGRGGGVARRGERRPLPSAPPPRLALVTASPVRQPPKAQTTLTRRPQRPRHNADHSLS